MMDRLPPEITLDNILPLLKLKDILHLSSTSKSLHFLISDQIVWKRRLLDDYNSYLALRILTQSENISLDWQDIYRRTLTPQVYVWGVATNGRLGIDFNDERIKRGNCVPQPIRIDTHANLVQLVAGGWSFHGLDRNGDITFWGQYNGDSFFYGPRDYRDSGARVDKPTKLRLPFKTVEMSAGRAHVMLLSDDGQVYQSTSCALPHRIIHPLLANDEIQQISAGWTHSAIFTKKGNIMVYWPLDYADSEAYRANHENGPTQRVERGVELIDTYVFEFTPPSITLPSIPNETISKIASAEGAIIALTQNGRLYRIDLHGRRGLRGEEAILNISDLITNGEKCWVELTSFSPQNLQKLLPEDTATPVLSHITSTFRQFTLYAPSVAHSRVFTGDATSNNSEPQLIDLDNVIDVVRGDYHTIALTRSGEVRSFGSQNGGALGVASLDYTRNGTVTTPLPVQFGGDKRKFAFTIAAAGWHSAALVIDLEGDDGDPPETVKETPPSASYTDRAFQMMANMRVGMIRRP